jgi:hypothetical protein
MIPVGNISGLLVRAWDLVKQRGLKKLAWILREYADREKQKEPNMWAFSRAALTRQLGSSGHRIREVLEFMEEKGWAVKAQRPAGCWHIN